MTLMRTSGTLSFDIFYEFQKKLKEGTYKLAQESMAFMGCASVHVSQLVKELTDEQREEVPVDENLIKVFNDWEN